MHRLPGEILDYQRLAGITAHDALHCVTSARQSANATPAAGTYVREANSTTRTSVSTPRSGVFPILGSLDTIGIPRSVLR